MVNNTKTYNYFITASLIFISLLGFFILIQKYDDRLNPINLVFLLTVKALIQWIFNKKISTYFFSIFLIIFEVLAYFFPGSLFYHFFFSWYFNS